MRRPSIFHRHTPMDVKMTPMIDVVFLLLVFFVWTASFQIPEYYLSSDLTAIAGAAPADVAPRPEEQDFPDLVIRIQWDAADERPVYVCGEVNAEATETIAGLATLRSRLAKVNRKSEPLILHPERNVPLGDVIDVFDAAISLGFTQVQFAATEDGGQ